MSPALARRRGDPAATSEESDPGLGEGTPPRGRRRRRTATRRASPGHGRWFGWLYVLPAMLVYGVFVLVPMARTVQYSFYDWNGVGPATGVGFDNYRQVFTDPELLSTIVHAFELLVFFTVIPIVVGLVVSSLVREVATGRFGTVARTTLFLPQIVPLVAAAIAWSWMYSSQGLVNQTLSLIGLEQLTRPWLSDFTWALPAVGLIGSWVMTGLCTVLFLSGMAKIDRSLYEAARVDGAGPVREFFAVTLHGLRQEIGVCVMITIIAALASFDVIYASTQGGPGRATLVPGVAIYRLAFTEHQVGLASALAIVLTVLVLACVLPIQRLVAEKNP